MRSLSSFFDLPVKEKQKFAKATDPPCGWNGMEREKLNPERPGDLKEAFNFKPVDEYDDWTVPEFDLASRDMFNRCKQLAERVCDVLSVGLGLRESFMREAHTLIGKKGNTTTLRPLYYPPLPEVLKIKQGQIRLGEHSDYGSITLLYQDNAGGLEVNIPGTLNRPARFGLIFFI